MGKSREPKYMIFDLRGMEDMDSAVCLGTAETLDGAERLALSYGGGIIFETETGKCVKTIS